MKSSTSFQKHIGRNSSSEDISDFELFYQLTYMSATAAAGISRSRIFELALRLSAAPATYFRDVSNLAGNLRYNYPDACRMVGLHIKAENLRTFLLRFSDALRSGEPVNTFLAREAEVQGENYSNVYERQLESLKKWNDGYIAVTVSVALIVIINMVSTMIYDIRKPTMIGMAATAVLMDFIVAWVLYRASPQESKSVSLAEGSEIQTLTLKLAKTLPPIAALSTVLLGMLGMNWGWIMIIAGVILAPVGIASFRADRETNQKDAEISSFLRSLGGQATSRGTTLTDALDHLKIDPFPALLPDIRLLNLRLRALSKPELCWSKFGTETGSKLINQTVNVFYEAIDLGGDPEQVGVLASLFALKTAMLRAKRRGISATFSWLTLIMHGVLVALMVFLLEILRAFINLLEGSMSPEQQQTLMEMDVLAFDIPDIGFLYAMVVSVAIGLSLINAFVITASEGALLSKAFYYLSILLVSSGIGFLLVPLATRYLAVSP